MTELIATVAEAARWASRGAAPGPTWNPVYRALAADADQGPGSRPAAVTGDATRIDDEGMGLVLRQLTSPALLVVAVTDGERTRRLRLGLDPAAVTLERSEGKDSSHWSQVAVQHVPGLLASLLEESGLAPLPARLDVRRREHALGLTPAQQRRAQSALARGLSAEEAFATVPALEDPLRDALTAEGPRFSVSLTLHDPRGRSAEEPVTWSRLWARGRGGLYRMDRPTGEAPRIHPVGDGDVLGTLLPLLEQGLRFAAACTAKGDAR